MTANYKPAVACNVRKDVIDAFATDCAQKLGFAPGAELEPIVKKLGGRITYQSLDDVTKNDASIRVDSVDNFEIFLPDHTSWERDRFSIAHELGHYLLHFPMCKEPMVAQRFGSNRVEWEANWFAAGFLMPAGEFKFAFGKHRSLALVAHHFGVSLAAAEARARALGLLL